MEPLAISHDAFGRLRLADFIGAEYVDQVGDWEYLDRRWIGESSGAFTEWLRLESEPDVTRSVAVDLAALPAAISERMLAALARGWPGSTPPLQRHDRILNVSDCCCLVSSGVMADDPPHSRPPLGRGRRTLIAALLVGGVVVLSASIRELIEGAMGSGPLADLGRIAVPMAATAWLAPHGSYRRRDALLWFLPPAGIYVFVVIAWRVAFLPYRDWTPRPDEAPRVHWLRDRQRAGLWYLRREAQ